MAVVNHSFVKSVYDELCKIATNTANISTTSARFSQLAWDLPRFGYADRETSATDSLIDKIAGRWPSLSRYFVESAVGRGLSIVKQDGDGSSALSRIKALIESFDTAVRNHTVFLPIVGLTVDELEISAGPVVLTKLSAADIQRFLLAVDEEEKAVRAATNAVGNLKFEVSPYYYEARRHALRNEIPGMVFIRCDVRGDEGHAWESATQTARQVIDALRFVMAIASGHDPRVGHVASAAGGGSTSMWILFDDGTRPQLHSFLGKGPHVLFRFDRNLVAELTKAGVWSVFDLLAVSRSEFREALFRAVRWLSKALIADDDNDSLLLAMISLESIFTRNPGDPVVRDVSEGCALLLGENVDEKTKIKRSVADIYKLRSSLAHGRNQRVSRQDANEAIAFAKAVVLKLLPRQDEFASLDDMTKMIERRKFGGD